MDLHLVMIGRLLLASLLGGLIGLEREIHGRPAGFRTHLLVSLGSCLFVVTSIQFYLTFGNLSGSGPLGVDPGRVAAQVVTGIGFLGAGAIIREGSSIRGLTTAACLWVAAAIGVSIGVGLYLISLAVTGVALISLLLLKKIENRIKRDSYGTIKIWSRDIDGQMQRLVNVLGECGLELLDADVEKDVVSSEIFFAFDVKSNTKEIAFNILDLIVAVEGVKKVRLD